MSKELSIIKANDLLLTTRVVSNKFNLYTEGNSFYIPSIGIGPGIPDYNYSLPKTKWKLLNRIIGAFNNRVIMPLSVYPNFTNAVSHALRNGYRLIDNSAAYRNEKLIGKAIKKSGIPRKDIIVTSRLTNKAQISGNVHAEFKQSLLELGVDYVDLYMFHWPIPGYFLEAWKQMEELYDEGLVKAIGVANCHIHHLEELLKIAKIKPVINQVEVHPLFTQKELIEYCQNKDIIVEAYTPLARNDDRLIRSPRIKNIAEKHDKTVQQIILRWHVQNGVIPVPRSLNNKRQIQNISIYDFNLSNDDMATIDSMNLNSRLRYDPDNCDFSIL